MRLFKLNISDLDGMSLRPAPGSGERANGQMRLAGRCANILALAKWPGAAALFWAVMFSPLYLPNLSDNGSAGDFVGIGAKAQNLSSDLFEKRSNPRAKMLLEADQLSYNNDDQSVAAIGNVQIAYDGYTLVSRQVTYYRATGRVIATGNVVIVEPNGNRIFAEEIDITDNFSDGFVSALQVETIENTRFAADSAERIDGNLTILNNGVYTACEVCKENPEKPPLWQIRARKVIIDKDAQKISYENASFEVFGKTVAYLPYFSHADPSIKRKSGLLIPSIQYSQPLGIGVTTGYFLNLAPSYDLTLSSTYFTKQGFLGQVEWRQRTRNGAYNLTFVGISQQDKGAFEPGTYDSAGSERYAFQTSGKFDINSRWKFGWQFLTQSDPNFARTYKVTTEKGPEVTNKIYLTGLNDKNFFDVRAQKILLQELDLDDTRQSLQAALLPVIDHNYVVDTPIANGQLSYNFNLINIDRHGNDIANFDAPIGLAIDERHHGIAGEHTRASANLEWKTNYITDNGFMFTPSLHGQVDGAWLNKDSPLSPTNPLTTNGSLYRAMPTVGLEIRYPMVARDGYASHVFEPVAQVFASTNETHIGEFPNEDAQSLVFDTTNLFSRNKFSGYDRIEGGIRANVGFRYSASFNTGASLDIAAGQSFHLAGLNSFAERDLVNAGMESGLETKRSDYVASAQYNTGAGLSARAGGRFDENNFSIRRGDLGLRYASPDFSAGVNYSYIQAQPNYGYTADRHEVTTSASIRLKDRWRAFGAITYDLETSSVVSDSIGIAYDDSCFSFSVAYNETRAAFTSDQVNQSISLKLGFRTIGNYDYKYNLENGVE